MAANLEMMPFYAAHPAVSQTATVQEICHWWDGEREGCLHYQTPSVSLSTQPYWTGMGFIEVACAQAKRHPPYDWGDQIVDWSNLNVPSRKVKVRTASENRLVVLWNNQIHRKCVKHVEKKIAKYLIREGIPITGCSPAWTQQAVQFSIEDDSSDEEKEGEEEVGEFCVESTIDDMLPESKTMESLIADMQTVNFDNIPSSLASALTISDNY